MGMRNLAAGQWTPCGSNGAGDCLVFEVEDATAGTIRISDTDRTFSGVIEGHEWAAAVEAFVEGEFPDDVQAVIKADTAKDDALLRERAQGSHRA